MCIRDRLGWAKRLYHLQQLAALGHVLPFGRIRLDVQQPGPWIGAGLMLLLGLGCLTVSRRQLAKRYQRWQDQAGQPGKSDAVEPPKGMPQ